MSELVVGGPDRTQLMAEDLGPVVGYLASRTYEAVALQPPQQFTPLETLEDLANFAEGLQHRLSLGYREVFEQPGGIRVDALQRLITDHKYPSIGPNEVELTYYARQALMMHESLETSVIMPLVSYRQLQIERSQPEFDARGAIRALRDRHFQTALLQLSNTHGGIYKNGSTRIYYLMGYGVSPFERFEREDAAIFDQDLPARLSDAAKTVLEHTREETEGKNGQSIGCPVRYATFQALGPYALAFAEDNNIDPEALMVQGKPAIVLGAEFVANELEKQLAFNEGNSRFSKLGSVVRKLFGRS